MEHKNIMYVTCDHAVSTDESNIEAIVCELKDRVEISDALYRFGLGQDLKDLSKKITKW